MSVSMSVEEDYPLCCFCNEPVYNRSSQAHSGCVKNPPIEWIEQHWSNNRSEGNEEENEPAEKRVKTSNEIDNNQVKTITEINQNNDSLHCSLSLEFSSE